MRKSQEPVVYRARSDGWELRWSTVDETSLPLTPSRATRSPIDAASPPVRATSPVLSARSKWPEKSPSEANRSAAPPPTGGGDEVSRLRTALAHANKTIALQQKIIEGLAKLRMHCTGD